MLGVAMIVRIRQIVALVFLIVVLAIALHQKVFADEYASNKLSISEQIKALEENISRLRELERNSVSSNGELPSQFADEIMDLQNEIAQLERFLCISCTLVAEYANIANLYVSDLSDRILPAMVILFASLVGLWVIIQAYRIMLGFLSPEELYRELVFVSMGSILLSAFGADFVSKVYHASLAIIGSASEIAFVLADKPDLEKVGITTELQEYQNLMSLIYTVEQSVRKVLNLAGSILGGSSDWNIGKGLLNVFYALVLILPYFLVGVVYFSQLVISVFRLMILAALSPFLMLAYAFNWGRPMVHSAIRTLLSSVVIMFAVTAAVAMVVYAVDRQNINSLSAELNIMDNQLILLIILGWMASGFMTEATHIANSITSSSLSNTGVGVLTAGATATAGFAWAQKNKANPLAWGRGYGNAREAFLKNKDGYGQMREDAGSLYQRVKDVSRGVKR